MNVVWRPIRNSPEPQVQVDKNSFFNFDSFLLAAGQHQLSGRKLLLVKNKIGAVHDLRRTDQRNLSSGCKVMVYNTGFAITC